MGEGQSITIRVCWRTIRNRKETSGNEVDGGPVRLDLVDNTSIGQMNLPHRNVSHR